LRLSNSLRLAAYALVALFGAFEIYTLWLMVKPDVPADYDAYYISKTTTCLNQPVSGQYPGGMVSFLPDGGDVAKPIKVCGWEGPAGDGTHAVGTSSRLRFVLDAEVRNPVLRVEAIAIKKDGVGMPQRIDVLVNGETVGEIDITADGPKTFDLPLNLPVAGTGTYDVTFEFPEAIKMGPTDPETRYRSIKLSAAGIVPASA
jgi:hypothetical protein